MDTGMDIIKEFSALLEPLNGAVRLVSARMESIEGNIATMQATFDRKHGDMEKLLGGSPLEARPGLANEHRELRSLVTELRAELKVFSSRASAQETTILDLGSRITNLSNEVDKLREQITKAHQEDLQGQRKLASTIQETFIRWFIPFLMMLIGAGILAVFQELNNAG